MSFVESPPRFNHRSLETYGNETSVIGKGSFGTIVATDRGYAIKTIEFADALPDIDVLNEIVYPGSISHPNIIKYHDVYLDNKSVRLVMDQYAGDLSNLPMSYAIGCFRSIAFQLVTTLAYLTSRNILHRDLKPHNILYKICATDVEENQVHCVLADFGLAVGRECMTELNEWEAYTSWYRPPEILLELTKYTASAEVWALGCTLYEIYTGEVLFRSKGSDMIRLIIEKVGGVSRSSALYADFMKVYLTGTYDDQDLIDLMSPQPPMGALIDDPILNDLLLRMVNPDPQLRESIFTLQNHPFFDGVTLNTPCYQLRRTHLNQCIDRATLFNRTGLMDPKFNRRVRSYELYAVIAWLLEMKCELQLTNATFILSVELLYRYINHSPTLQHRYQLIGIMCLYIAVTFLGPLGISTETMQLILGNFTYTLTQGQDILHSILTTLNYDLCATTNHDRIVARRIRYEEPVIQLASDLLVMVAPIPALYNRVNIAEQCLNLAVSEFHPRLRSSDADMDEFKLSLITFYNQHKELKTSLSIPMYSKFLDWKQTLD